MARRDPRGITHPSVDQLTARAGGRFQLAVTAAKRARQLVAFYGQLGEGLLEYNGPVVIPRPGEKPLSTAFREIGEGLIVSERR